MTVSGRAAFFDGAISARREVTVELAAASMRVLGADGSLLAEWPLAELEPVAARGDLLRLARAGSSVAARLEIRDRDLAAQLELQAPRLDRSGARARRAQARVVGWSVAATLSLVLTAVFAVPQIAAQLAPMVPASLERKL